MAELITGLDSTGKQREIKVGADGTVAVSVDTSTLATAAAQATGNASLSSIDGKASTANTSLASIDDKLPNLVNGRVPATLASAGTTGSTAPSTANLSGCVDGSGNLRALRSNASGATHTVPAIGTTARSSGFAASFVASNTACHPSRARVHSKNAGTLYVHWFNASALPANGATPDEIVVISANNAAALPLSPCPTNGWSSGMVGGLSTTQATLTVLATSDGLWAVDFFPAQA